MRLYHFTTQSNWTKIQKEGLRPQKQTSYALYNRHVIWLTADGTANSARELSANVRLVVEIGDIDPNLRKYFDYAIKPKIDRDPAHAAAYQHVSQFYRQKIADMQSWYLYFAPIPLRDYGWPRIVGSSANS